MRPPLSTADSQDQDHQATPPQPPGSGARGPGRDYRKPASPPLPLPPLSSPASGQPEAGRRGPGAAVPLGPTGCP